MTTVLCWPYKSQQFWEFALHDHIKYGVVVQQAKYAVVLQTENMFAKRGSPLGNNCYATRKTVVMQQGKTVAMQQGKTVATTSCIMVCVLLVHCHQKRQFCSTFIFKILFNLIFVVIECCHTLAYLPVPCILFVHPCVICL